MISDQLIRDRGWSKKMIDNHLEFLDETSVNHINPCYLEHKYYLKRRIFRIEEFRIYMMKKRKN